MNPGAPVYLVVNRAPRDAFRKAELEQEIRRTFEPEGLSFLPHDPRVEAAAWAGDIVAHGPYTKAVSEVAVTIAPPTRAAPPARRAAGRRHSRSPVMAR
jgi:hypothetical protein